MVSAGLYDVVVRSSRRDTREVPAVAAGTEDLVVRLEGEPAARVAVEVGCEVELEQVIVLAALLLVPAVTPRLPGREVER